MRPNRVPCLADGPAVEDGGSVCLRPEGHKGGCRFVPDDQVAVRLTPAGRAALFRSLQAELEVAMRASRPLRINRPYRAAGAARAPATYRQCPVCSSPMPPFRLTVPAPLVERCHRPSSTGSAGPAPATTGGWWRPRPRF